MKNPNLMQFIKQHNDWNAIIGGTQYSVRTVADRQRVAEAIDSALSPENLSCDGELPIGQVRARYRQLTAAARELRQMDPSVRFYEYAE